MKNNVCNKFTRIICIVFAFFLLTACLSSIVANASDDEATESQSVLPKKVDLTEDDEYKNYFPDLKHQAATSCAAWATAYYQFTFEMAKKLDINVQANNNNLAFSPDYMFNYLNFMNTDDDGNYKEGLSFKDCYDFLKKQGCIRYSDFYGEDSAPYRWYTADTEAETLNNMHNALQYRVSEAHNKKITDSSNNTFITAPDDPDLNEMKTLLRDGYLLGITTPTKNVKKLNSSVLVSSHHLLDKENNPIKNTTL